MAFTVKDIITEALVRANLVGNRRQEPSGSMMESAFNLLKGIAADYSNHNLLQFLRREIILPKDAINETQYIIGNGYKVGYNFWFIINGDTSVLPEANSTTLAMGCEAWDKGGTHVYKIVQSGQSTFNWVAHNYSSPAEAMEHLDNAVVRIVEPGMKTTMILGTVDPEINGDYVNAVVDNVASIKEAYIVLNDRLQEIPINFVSLEDFYNANYGNYVYTWQFISDRKLEFKTKQPVIDRAKEIRIIYNVAYSFNLNSTLKIPDVYNELFTVALTYKLAVEYPRLDPSHTQRLKDTLTEIENTIKAPTRANKLVIRPEGNINTLNTIDQIVSGSFIFPL